MQNSDRTMELEYNEAVEFFSNKFGKDDQRWLDVKKHVETYNLDFEVFVGARSKVNEASNYNECMQAIYETGLEWDI